MRGPRLRVIGERSGLAQEARFGPPDWLCPRKLLANAARRILLWLHLTRLEPQEFDDQVTGVPLVICRSARYLMVNVGSRQYYFDPLTGKLDGTGSLLCGG